MKLHPKCVLQQAQESMSNNGYITPCCWVDNMHDRQHPLVEALYSEHLHIDNIESREELLLSDEWVAFFDVIINKPEEAPACCFRECGKVIKGKLSDNSRSSYRRDSYFGEEAIKIIDDQ